MTEATSVPGVPAAPERGPRPLPEETMSERVAYRVFRAAEVLAMALPEDWGRPLFRAGGVLAYHVGLKARATVQRNLARVLGKDPGSPLVRAATREAFISYARYWYDTFRVRVMSDQEFLRRFHGEGLDHLVRAVEAGKGAVLALPHLGNWDAAGKWVQLQGFRITAVAELLKPERLFRLFLDHRRALGMGIVPLNDDRKVGEELVRLIGQNVLIALVADRDLKGKGIKVEMFGEERRIPAGPALLSLATGSPLLPSAAFEIDDGGVIHIYEPLEVERSGDLRTDVTNLTRELAKWFEHAIASAPTQWHMFQPAWEGEPGAEASDGEGPAPPPAQEDREAAAPPRA